MWTLLGVLVAGMLGLLVLARIKRKWFGETITERIQTVCTIVQTLVVAVGVVFAIVELKNWTAERDQERKAKTLERLSRLHQDLQPAVDVVNAAHASTFFAGLPWMPSGPQVSADDFDTQTKPLVAFFDELRLCVSLGECDGDAAARVVCSIVQTYHFSWMKTRPVAIRPTQPGEKWRGAPTWLLLDMCPSVRDALSQFYELPQMEAAQGKP